MSLGTKLREMRHEKNLSQTQVAVELDVSQTAYGKWESDQTKPGIDNLLKISEFYGIDIYDLLDSKEGNHNFNNTYDNSNVNNAVETVNYYLSDKLIEQYEARIKDLQENNKQLQEQLNYLKQNKQ